MKALDMFGLIHCGSFNKNIWELFYFLVQILRGLMYKTIEKTCTGTFI